VEYHFWPNDSRTHPPTMLGVLRGLRQRGLRVFSVEPNVRPRAVQLARGAPESCAELLFALAS